MSALPAPRHDPAVHNAALFLQELLRGIAVRDFAVRLWDGTIIPAVETHPTRFTLVIQHPAALRRMFASPTERNLGEAYIYDDCDIEGDIEAAVHFGRTLISTGRRWGERLRLNSLLHKLPKTGPMQPRLMPRLHGRLHSPSRDRQAIHYHYDVSNDFYALFLDSRMNYSAGFFAGWDDHLDAAQLLKLERICQALELRPGERLLDIGCGWGGLIIHAAQKFGVEALGITLSEQQAAFARNQIRSSGLEARCRVEIRDYRNLQHRNAFDKVASVGMVEHVGARRLGEYFRQAARLLRPGGLFFNSGISRPITEAARSPDSFTDAYVFPDGELEPISEMLAAAEAAGFEVSAVENLREHYAVTLRHWVQRLESRAADARRLVGDSTYRLWRLYMAGSAEQFSAGKLHLFQAVLIKPAHAQPRLSS